MTTGIKGLLGLGWLLFFLLLSFQHISGNIAQSNARIRDKAVAELTLKFSSPTGEDVLNTKTRRSARMRFWG